MTAVSDSPQTAPSPTAPSSHGDIPHTRGQKTLATLRECHFCGHFSHLPPLVPGTDARCPRCDGVLRRERKNPLDTGLCCALAGLMFYAVAVTSPFLEVRLSGQYRISMLETGPLTLQQEGLPEMGLLVLLCTQVFPLIKLLIQVGVLLGLRLRKPPRWLHIPFRFLERLSPWAMTEVFMLGLFVAYTRLVALAQVQIEMAVFALVGLMLSMVCADAALDPETVWEEMERRDVLYTREVRVSSAPSARLIGCHVCHRVNHARPGASCTRCGSKLHVRKRDSVARSWALMLASIVLYIPANTFSVMNITRLGSTSPHTILGGAKELLDAGLWPLALLVFFASITVPVLKLVSLTTMLVGIHRRSDWQLLGRTRLYRVVDFIGRWSMIDVFMISILVALVQFGQLASITSDIGAMAFAAVVVLTMFATEGFDPRLMWDAAGQNPDDKVRPQA